MKQKKNPIVAQVSMPPSYTKFYNFFDRYGALILFSLLLIAVYFVYNDFIFLKKYAIFIDKNGSDSFTSTYTKFVHLKEMYLAQGFPKWSFEQGLGQNVFAGCVTDIFITIAIFFTTNLYESLGFAIIAQLLCSGMCFYWLLREIKISGFSAVMAGFMYAFCGYVLLTMPFPNLTTDVYMLPVLMLAYERLEQKKSWWLMPIAVCYVVTLNAFSLFIMTIFLGLYILFRFFQGEDRSLSHFVALIGKLALLYLVGVLMSSFFSVNNLIQMIESPRVLGENSFFDKLKNADVLFVKFEAFFVTINRFFSNDIIGVGDNYKAITYISPISSEGMNYFESPILFCGLLTLLLVPQAFVGLKKRQILPFSLFFGFHLLVLFVPYLRWLYYGFSIDYYRYVGLFMIVVMLIYAAYGLDNMMKKESFNYVILLITLGVLLSALYFIKFELVDVIDHDIQNRVAIFLCIYATILLLGFKTKLFRPALLVLLVFLVMAEEVVAGKTTLDSREYLSYKDKTKREKCFDYTQEAVAYINSIDSGFYRVVKPYYTISKVSTLNDSKLYGFKSYCSYNSFNNLNYVKMLEKIGSVKIDKEITSRWIMFYRPYTCRFLGVKYALTKQGADAFNLSEHPAFCDTIAAFNNISVLRLKKVYPLGITMDKMIPESDLDSMSYQEDRAFSLLKRVVVADSLMGKYPGLRYEKSEPEPLTYNAINTYYEEVTADTLTLTQFNDTHFEGNISLKQPKMLILQFPYDKGWKATVNGESYPIEQVDIGLTGLYLSEGEHDIVFNYLPLYYNETKWVSFAALMFYLMLVLGEILFKKTKKQPDEIELS